MKAKYIDKKYVYLLAILCVGFIVYAVRATYAGLWYDEAIEYYFSKYMIGTVPGSQGTTNMYQRICSTYQPPLYNFLMYFWLKLFDSEFGFRLAGIITTLCGAVGIFKAVDEQTKDGTWASIGSLIYIFTSGVAYYGLECAEYNLMLCFVAWTVFFYVRVMKRLNLSSLIGFFVFASLSVYSQYGAVFVVIGMFVSISIRIIQSNIKELMIQGIIVVIVTAIVAVIPLLKFFLLPQMMKQGSASVSHYPVFTHNVVVDYVWGMVRSLNSFFVSYSLPLFGKIILCCVLFFAMFTLIAMLKDKTLISFVGAILCAWTLYFIAVACSFYGYNYWDGTLGCNNIGERYALFFVPIIIVTLVTGGKAFLSYFTNESLYKIAIMFFALWTLLFCTVEIVKIDVYGWEKDDVREVTQLWYESDAYNVPTLVHEWDDAMFNYYMVHNTNYNEEYDYNVKSAENWIRSADSETMEDGLQKMGYLDLDEYYYITPVVSYHDSYEAFMQVMDLYGYNIDVIYEGDSALLHVVKS